jgi:hypothetical protein
MRRSAVRQSSAYFELFYTLNPISLQRNEFLWFQKFSKNGNVNACFLTGSTVFVGPCCKKYSLTCPVTIDLVGIIKPQEEAEDKKKGTEEYYSTMTHAVGRSRCGRSNSSVLEFHGTLIYLTTGFVNMKPHAIERLCPC